MKKSSLGRRSTLGASRLSSKGPEGNRKDKVSGIPVKMMRNSSADRVGGAGTSRVPSTDRASIKNMAAINNQPKQTPASARNFPTPASLPSGTLRPFRATTMSTDSGRLSSCGGVNKKDPRPLHDKEWQQSTERELYNFFADEGSSLLSDGNIKQMSLNRFIEVLDYLFKKFDSNFELNKVNYKQELPLMLKRMEYNGKIDKSLLSTVNAPHSWPYTLGILQFVLETVKMCSVDPIELMYPQRFDDFAGSNDEKEHKWDFKKLMPYLHKLYELKQSAQPDMDYQMDALKEKMIREHFPEDLSEALENERMAVALVEEQVSSLERELEKMNIDFYNETLKNLENDMLKEREFATQLELFIQNMTSRVAGLEMECDQLRERLGKVTKERDRLKEDLKEEEVLNEENELRKQRRNSLLRKTETVNTYIEQYSSMIYAHDMQMLAIKKKVDETLLEYNMMIANLIELEPELEGLKLEDNPMSIDIDQFSEKVSSIVAKLKTKYTELISDAKKEITKMTESITQFEERLKKLLAAEAEQASKRKKFEDKCKILKKKNDKKLAEHQTELEELDRKCANADETIKKLNSQLAQMRTELKEKTAKKRQMEKELVTVEEKVTVYMRRAVATIKRLTEELQAGHATLVQLVEDYRKVYDEC